MTAEQLQTVRAERWRHIANPLLTADDARAWLDAAGLCLFLPRRQQFLAPAPSFVEACAGAPSETPSREAIDNAAGLMHRLAAEGAILPLNLFGTPSETPDFLATREAFPHLFSLRGMRDWKTAPAGKSSPLVIEIWKLLEKEGTLTAVEIQSALGRELTEAAVLRGLMELWSNLRVLPEFESGAPTRWSLTQLRFKDALNAAAKLSQTTALSALVSLYLESVIAATSEEIETFLSPLTSRSRVRETVNGLAATRQLAMLPVGTQSMFHIAGALPEFAEPEVAAKPDAEARPAVRQTERAPRTFDRERKPFERKTGDRKTGDRKTGERKTFGRKPFERGAQKRSSSAREGAPRTNEGERKPWPRKAEGERSERKPFGKRPAFGKKPFDKTARPFRRDAGPGERPAGGERAASGTGSGFRPAARGGSAPRSGAGGKFPPKRFGSKPAGGKFEGREKRPWTPRPSTGEGKPGGEGRPAAASGDRPFRPREAGAERRPGGFGAKGKSFGSKFGGSKFSGGKKFDGPGAGRPGTGRAGAGRPRPGGAPTGGARFGGAKFGGAKSAGRGKPPEGEKRPFFRKRDEEGSAGAARPRSFSRPASGGPRPPSRGAGGAGRTGTWKGKTGSGSAGGPRFSKPGAGFSKPAAGGSERPARPSFGKSAGFAKSGKPGFSKGKPGGGAFKGRPSGGKTFGGGKKFGGAGSKFGGAKKFGARKPGGAKPPFRKRKDGDGNGGSKNAE